MIVRMIFHCTMFCVLAMSVFGASAYKTIDEAMRTYYNTKDSAVKNEVYEYLKTIALTKSNYLGEEAVFQLSKMQSREAVELPGAIELFKKIVAERKLLPMRKHALNALCDFHEKNKDSELIQKLESLMPLIATDARLKSILLARFMKLYEAKGEHDKALRHAADICALSEGSYYDSLELANYFLVKEDLKLSRIADAEKGILSLINHGSRFHASIDKMVHELKIPASVIDKLIAAIHIRIEQLQNIDKVNDVRDSLMIAQLNIVNLLVYAGRHEQAASECRILNLLATDKEFKGVVGKTADIFKRLDGNIGRSIRFMNFHKKDYIPSDVYELLKFPQMTDPVRIGLIKKLDAYKGDDSNKYLRNFWLYIWADEPVKAVRSAVKAFSTAPMQQQELQRCANLIMHPMSVFSRDPKRINDILSYLMNGGCGADNIIGTGDDVKDPVASMEAFLKNTGFTSR